MKNIYASSEAIFENHCKAIKDKNIKINTFIGAYGIGKTNTALLYCEQHTDSLYFSFKNLDAVLAPSVFSDANNWEEFFNNLVTWAKRKIPVVFFDDFGDRNDKEIFLKCLMECLLKHKTAFHPILIIHEGESFNGIENTRLIKYSALNPVLVRKAFDKLSEREAFKLFALTDGYYELLQQYDDMLSFEDNLRCFLNRNSDFYRYAADYLHHFFRSPESYNTLLYAMATGHNTISKISDFSGYPRNKCDKYIKALLSVGIVIKCKDKNGHSVYEIKNNYFKLWYKYLFTAQADINGNFNNETITAFIEVLENAIVPATFSKWCRAWIQDNKMEFSRYILHTEERKNQNIEISGITFDYVEYTDGKYLLLKTYTEKPAKEDWLAVEKASLALAPFYDVQFVLATMADFSPFYWDLIRRYDNIHLVRLRSLNIDKVI